MQKIKFFLNLVPRGLNQFGLMISEVKIKRKGTVELNVEGNGLPFYYLFNYCLVRTQPRP